METKKDLKFLINEIQIWHHCNYWTTWSNYLSGSLERWVCNKLELWFEYGILLTNDWNKINLSWWGWS